MMKKLEQGILSQKEVDHLLEALSDKPTKHNLLRKWLRAHWKAIIVYLVLTCGVFLYTRITINNALSIARQPVNPPHILNLQSYDLTAADGRSQREYVIGFVTPENIVIETNIKITNTFDK